LTYSRELARTYPTNFSPENHDRATGFGKMRQINWGTSLRFSHLV
jgi:hypothetical protein